MEFLTNKTIKGGALAEFNAEWKNPRPEEDPEEEKAVPGKVAPDCWTMHFDGAFSYDGSVKVPYGQLEGGGG
jgi:hypothetical protein